MLTLQNYRKLRIRHYADSRNPGQSAHKISIYEIKALPRCCICLKDPLQANAQHVKILITFFCKLNHKTNNKIKLHGTLFLTDIKKNFQFK